MSNNNPFSNNRAEYMRELWKYYVPNEIIDFSSSQPMCIEGGRGTGKTTLFLCNCWREILSKYKSNNEDGIDKILENGTIGLYYKVDPVFVNAMKGDNRSNEEWGLIFSSYLSMEILTELIYFLKEIEKERGIKKHEVKKLSDYFYEIVHCCNKTVGTLDSIINCCKTYTDAIEDILNGKAIDEINIRLSRAGTLVTNVIHYIRQIYGLENVTLKIYIDEYESLFSWQQTIVNTLIKKSNNSIIYNIGYKPKGMKTATTLAEDQPIERTHDYKYYNLDTIVGAGYSSFVKRICERRLSIFSRREDFCEIKISVDIEDYLGKYSIEEEEKQYLNKKRPKFYGILRDIITEETLDKHIVRTLCDEATPLEARIHLSLLLRNRYRPSVKELYDCFLEWKQNKNSDRAQKYNEWHHNMQSGAMFMLAKSYRMKKWYCGYDVYLQLSSGIIRFFLELCEHAFAIALQEDYEWGRDILISNEIQTRAAQLFSKKQIMEIESYAMHGKQMMIMTQALGGLFKELHRDENLTLGEPEPNHFSVNTMDLQAEIKDGLDTAVRYSVLQVFPSTKEKEGTHTRTLDYHLNKVYAPYFEISCKKNRKIDVTAEFIDMLFSADRKKAEYAVRDYLKKYWKNKNRAFGTEGLKETNGQLSLFDKGDGND